MTSYSSFQTNKHAQLYSKFRPEYPDETFNIIMKHLQENHNGPYALAVDVGCGGGKSTLPLAPYFQQVLGLDISEAQITQAKKKEATNITFQVGSAFVLPVNDCSSDLVTVGTAAHWISPIEDFYKEWIEELRPYISDATQLLLNERYSGFQMPWSKASRSEINTTLVMSLTDFRRVIQTGSYVQRFHELHTYEPDVTDVVIKRLHDALDPGQHKSDEELYLEIGLDIVILLARKPA